MAVGSQTKMNSRKLIQGIEALIEKTMSSLFRVYLAVLRNPTTGLLILV